MANAGFAADILFPRPLHLTRRISDPVSGTTSTVHQYCAGNRVVTVKDSRVAIEDYTKQELTEIDRTAGTFSVTSFADLANASHAVHERNEAPQAASLNRPRWQRAALGTKSSPSGRSMDAYEMTSAAPGGTKVTIGVDRSVRLSHEAVAVLIGATFPNPRTEAHDAILEAAAEGPVPSNGMKGAAEVSYGLPVEQVTTFDGAGESLVLRDEIVEIREELPPQDALIIPTGATRVESHAVRVARELRALDQLPAAVKP
jgi:hypothetical protein